MNQQEKSHIVVISTKNNPFLNGVIASNLGVELAVCGLKTIIIHNNDSFLSEFFRERKHLRESYPVLPSLSYKVVKDNISEQIQECNDFDVIIISSAGNRDDFKSSFFFADTLITVLDEKISLSMLSNPTPSKKSLLQPSAYTNFVWEIKKHLAATQKKSLNWAVLPYQNDELAVKQLPLLTEIAKNYGFRISPHINPRETFSELFNKGLTLFDLSLLKQMKSFEQLGAKRDCRKFAEFVLNLQKK